MNAKMDAREQHILNTLLPHYVFLNSFSGVEASKNIV